MPPAIPVLHVRSPGLCTRPRTDCPGTASLAPRVKSCFPEKVASSSAWLRAEGVEFLGLRVNMKTHRHSFFGKKKKPARKARAR